MLQTLKFKKIQLENKVMKWMFNEKSVQDTTDKGAWVFFGIVIALIVALILKGGSETGFKNVVDTFVKVTGGDTGVPGGWGGTGTGK